MSAPDITSDIERLSQGVRSGNRALLARAITLVESRKSSHQRQARALLHTLLPDRGKAWRIGITGVPGVGKSTLIDQLGMNLISEGHRVAVLAVDPTSGRTGGSILGDKTRMQRLALDDNAFIRPSPTSGTLGGVAKKTRETMALCEAAGFDVIIVETVGVGQSETAVAEMVDFFLVLLLPGGGDELQGLKKGLIELADMIAVNKADGDNAVRAQAAAREYKAALHILTHESPNWSPPVITVSGRENLGMDELWSNITQFYDTLTASGELDAKRREQAVRWMREMIETRVMQSFWAREAVAETIASLENAVRRGDITPENAVETVLAKAGIY